MIKKLNKIERIINSTKWNKLFHFHFYYLYAYVFRQYIFPKTKEPVFVKRKTFFNKQFTIKLPASNDIYIYGTKSHVSETKLSKFLIQYLKPNNTFVDVGAHFGFFSALASSLLKNTGEIFSFEAAPNTFEVLEMNMQGISNANYFNKAVSNKKEQIDFHEFPLKYSEYNSINKKQYENSDWLAQNEPNTITIDAVTLDNVFNNKYIDILKIDVEGAELKVLQGMSNLLNRKKVKYIVLEYLKHNGTESVHFKAAKYLFTFNYIPFSINSEGVLEAIEGNNIINYLKKMNTDSENIVFKTNR